jgi:Flp pilus assembly secretin CpaC
MSERTTAILAAAALLLAASCMNSAALGAEAMLVPAGSAVIVRLDRPARQVIVGNPAVADVTVQSPRLLTVFGKAVSATTLTVLGDGGRIVLEAPIVVGPGSDASLGVIYASGKGVPNGGQHLAVECAAASCVAVR